MSDLRKLGKTARVKIYQGKWTDGTRALDPGRYEVDKVFDGRVGVNHDGTLFGLVDDWNLPYDLADDVARLSHMSYYLDEWFAPAKVIARLRDPKIKFGLFLFNAGGMGMAAVWAEVDDLERAFRDLDLL